MADEERDWKESRLFVMKELERTSNGIHSVRNTMNSFKFEVLEKFGELDKRLVKLTLIQTGILSAAALAGQWILHHLLSW